MNRSLLPMALAAAALLLPPPAASQAFDLPEIPRCTQFTPGAIAAGFDPSRLAVRVVLDGIGAVSAGRTVSRAMTSYIPQGIQLEVSYDTADFDNSDGSALIDEVRNSYGGRRPPGVHLVYVMTSKDLTDSGVLGSSLAGLADCIGGVAYAENAFAVGEGNSSSAAEIMAHELGHLLGGHHHYANCAESLPNGGSNACTLMFNDIGLAALPFSSLNGTVVRGHSQVFGGGEGTAPDAGGGGGGGSLGLLPLPLLGLAARRRFSRRG